jgi:beta-galactosidase
MKRLTFFIFLIISGTAFSQRTVISLNGTWQIEQGVSPSIIPRKFDHIAEVPGLVNLAVPSFVDVDKFDGVDYLRNYWVKRFVKDINADTIKVGIPRQQTNYFWYRRDFKIDNQQERIILKINKAQFGTAVWVNGKKSGEHNGCFTAAYFDITSQVKMKGNNSVVIRVGAHPGVLPVSVPGGSDYEKPKWTPGIYDEVSIIATSSLFISNIQVAPDIYRSLIKVQSEIINHGPGRKISLNYRVKPFHSGEYTFSKTGSEIYVPQEDTLVVIEEIEIPGAKLWSPEEPNLYVLETTAGKDQVITRFGMREFKFDTFTKRAYLNGEPYFLRGSNITLHRFFDDDHCGNKPWNEEWVRKLLTGWPGKFHWNSFRFCIGPVPDKWLDIADETGLLIQNEFFIWPYRQYWDTLEIKNQVTEWMRDNWNHSSIAWWDICNETDNDELRDVIRKVRTLDLSGRAWDNGYGLPVGANDPVEDHNYLNYSDRWQIEQFEDNVAAKTTNSPHPTAHACVLNEYGWLWLNRDGSPTLLTRDVYDKIAPGFSNQQRIELAAYLLGIETEYFRAHRNYAGVMHFTFLTGNFNNVITGDLFKDIEELTIHPAYQESLVEAFRPVGVYINFTREFIGPGEKKSIRVMMVNDRNKQRSGRLKLSISDSSDKIVLLDEKDFSLDSFGQQTVEFNISVPVVEGKYIMKAEAISPEEQEPTVSTRKMTVLKK